MGFLNILLYVSLVGHGSVVSPDSLHTGVIDPVLLSTPPHFSSNPVLRPLSDGFYESESLEKPPVFIGGISDISPITDGSSANSKTAFKETTDPAVPDPPTLLQTDMLGFHRVDLIWGSPISDGGSPLTGYKIEWSTDGGTSWEVLVDDTERTTQNYSFFSSRLTPGATFHFRVRALNADGESAPSNVVSITAAASSGAGIPTNVTVTQTSTGAAMVSWAAPTDLADGQTPFIYAIYKTDDNGQFWAREGSNLRATTFSYTDESVSYGTTYGYRVLLFYQANDLLYSDFSAPVFITPVAPPPRNLQVNSQYYNFAYLWWDAPSSDGGSPITGYKVEWSTDGGTNWEVLVDDTERTTRNYSFLSSRLTPGATFHFRVSALNADGESASSNAVSFTAPSPSGRGIPTNVRVTETSSGAAQISWDAPTDLPDGQSVWTYYLYKSDDNGDFWSQLAIISAPTLSYTDNSVSRGRTYGYRVHTAYGVNRNNTTFGDYSEPAFLTIPLGPPPPINLSASPPKLHDITFFWDPPSSNGGSPITGYKVEWSTDGGTNWSDIVGYNDQGIRLIYGFLSSRLTAGSRFHFRVRALNANGESGPSNEVEVTAVSASGPGIPTNVRVTQNSSGAAQISWDAPTDLPDGQSTFEYILYRSNDDGDYWSLLQRGIATTGYTDQAVLEGNTYGYRVIAVNGTISDLAQASQFSDAIFFSIPVVTVDTRSSPSNLRALSVEPTRVRLQWNTPRDGSLQITGYRIEVSPNGTDSWTTVGSNTSFTTTETSYTHTGLALETEYHYRVYAISRQAGESIHPSNIIRITTGPSLTPNRPLGVRATAGTDRSATVTWTAPYDGGSPITGYEVNYNFSGERDYIWNNQPSVGPAIRSYTHMDLVVDSTYRYFVRAINAKGEGSRSEIVRARITGTVSAPTAPQSLTATPGGHTIINLRWAPPESHGGSLVIGYKIEVSTDGTSFTELVANTMSTATFYQHTGLSRGDERHYRITAITDRFPVGTVSEVVRGETGTPPAITAPSAPRSLTAMADGQTTINLSWTAPESTGGTPITGYQIEVSPNGTSEWTDLADNTESTATTYSHTGLSASTTRHYRVSAINIVDTSTPSDVALATTAAVATATAPGAPTSLTATASGQTTINLSWTAPTSTGGAAITGYKIEVSTDGGGTFTQLVESHPTPPYAHTGLSAATTRHYRVSAINSVNTGPVSNVAMATTADAANPTAPGAPTSLTATASGPTIINLRWTAPSSNGGARITGYQIEVSTDGGNTFDSTPLVARHPTTSYSHTGLTAGVTRHYRVRAINSAGPGAASNIANATTASGGGGGGGDEDDDGGGEDDATAPALTFTVASASVDEAAGTYPISVALSASSSTATTLSYTLSGTATQGSDYTIQASVTLAANATTAQIPIVIVDDQDEEPDETVIVTLASGDGYTLGSTTAFTLTITDNDATALSFAQTLADQSYDVGLAIDDLTLPAARQGTQPYSYTLTPELPKGLMFDASTRILRGTPTEATAAKTYTYTATDASANSATLTFTIAIVQAEALTLTETVGDQRVPVERLLKDLVFPVATGGIAPYSYTLTPELPSGLMFDAASRTLSGTPSEVAAAQMYTYSVQDQAGTRFEQAFTLEVYQLAFAETVPNQTYSRAQPIDPLTLPEATGAAPITYTLTLLDLPLGLRYDASARTISGTPTEVAPPVSLTYKATDINGASDSLMFTVEVISPVQTEGEAGLPEAFQVYPNYPNPFYRSTHLVFDLPWAAQVHVEVLDVIGRRMATPQEVHLSAGWRHELELTDLGLPAGPYLYQLRATSLEDHSSSVYVGHFISVQ